VIIGVRIRVRNIKYPSGSWRLLGRVWSDTISLRTAVTPASVRTATPVM